MQPNIYKDNYRDMHHHHAKCRKHLYQLIQVELKDGSVHQGILHSYDNEKMYLLMPKMEHMDHSHMSTHMADESSESRQFFPFFGPFGLFGFPFFGIRRFGPFFPFFI
jgi:small nuclear ribonucleoprotein (snRNP)-like protein